MPFFAPLALATLAIVQVRPDTGPDTLERWVAILSGIATIVIALALIAIFMAIIPLALSARRAQRRVGTLLDGLQESARPIMAHAESVADNVDFMSTAVRADVERLKRTIDAAQDRLERAAEGAEERISRFNSLLDLVQEEAESLFIGTASTVRGMRAGAQKLRDPSPDLAWESDETGDEPFERSRRQL